MWHIPTLLPLLLHDKEVLYLGIIQVQNTQKHAKTAKLYGNKNTIGLKRILTSPNCILCRHSIKHNVLTAALEDEKLVVCSQP